MRKKGFLGGVVLLLVLLLTVGCGIPKETYEAVVAERDSAQTELESVRAELQSVGAELQTVKSDLDTAQTKIESLQSDLDTAQSESKSLQSDLSKITSLWSSLEKKLDLGGQVLAFQSGSLRVSRAEKEGKEAEEKRLRLLGLSIFKSYDSLVEDVGDTELSRLWGETWPEGAREQSEKEKSPVYVHKAYAKFLDRLSLLVKGDMDELRPLLEK